MKWLLNKLFTREDITSGADFVYLQRWVIWKVRGYACYLHRFLRDDGTRSMHDHPKRFVSIGLRGWYVEETPTTIAPENHYLTYRKTFSAPWVRSFPPSHIHRISAVSPSGCWTLILTGPARQNWGFYVMGPKKMLRISWKNYAGGLNEQRRPSEQ